MGRVVACFSEVLGALLGLLLGVFGYVAIWSLNMLGFILFIFGLVGMFGDRFAKAAGLFVAGCLFLWLGGAAVRFTRAKAGREELRQGARAQEIADDIE